MPPFMDVPKEARLSVRQTAGAMVLGGIIRLTHADINAVKFVSQAGSRFPKTSDGPVSRGNAEGLGAAQFAPDE